MVNCFVCQTPFEKGVGLCCSRKCHNVRINSQRDYKNTQLSVRKQMRVDNYNINPNQCAYCHSSFEYQNRNKRFCNNSCAASFNNNNRSPEIHRKQSASLLKTLDRLNRTIRSQYPYTKVTFAECKSCTKIFRRAVGKLYCSELCKLHAGVKIYRRACKFSMSKTQYPQLFNSDLLNTHGWYRASNHPKGYNPHGATWDHLFRIEDGFKLGVDPAIMRHPANAEMISWKENFERKTSKITYQELLNRIAQWKG